MRPVLASSAATSTFSSPGTRMRLNVISAAESGLVASSPILAPTPSRVEGSSFEPWLSGTTTGSRSAWKRVAPAPSTSGGIVDIDILVHDDHVLHVVVPGKGAEHDVLGLALLALANLDVEVIAACAAAGEMHVAHIGEGPLQVRQQRRFARDRAKQQVLQT